MVMCKLSTAVRLLNLRVRPSVLMAVAKEGGVMASVFVERYPVGAGVVSFTGRFFEHGDNGDIGDKCPQWRQEHRQW